jgi:hypothetical protein
MALQIVTHSAEEFLQLLESKLQELLPHFFVSTQHSVFARSTREPLLIMNVWFCVTAENFLRSSDSCAGISLEQCEGHN